MRSNSTLDEIDVLRIIRKIVNASPSQAGFARKVGISPPHLSMMLSADRPISDAVLKAAGIRRRPAQYEIFKEVTHVK